MKKILALLLAMFAVFSLTACGGGTDDPTSATETTADSSVIEWYQLPDTDIVGAWEPKDAVDDELILFTPESKLRVVSGTVVIEADVNFGVDGAGNKSAYTEGNYLYGQWVYTVKDGTLTVTYPEGREEVFTQVEYTPITLVAKEDFVADRSLVGVWSNEQYMDGYEFTADGYAIYTQQFDDGIYVYDTEIKYTYTVSGNEITFFYFNTAGEELTHVSEYSVEGETLLVDGNDYTLQTGDN